MRSEMTEQTENKDPFKVLVVDDDPAVRKVFRRALEEAGFHVLEAGDGKTAVALMAEGPDLVLQDLILPDISGYDLVSKLQAHMEEKPVPILALSGFLAQPDEPWDTSAGFDALLVKPISPSELVKVVKDWLGK
jgi:two-component system KDP operon response regulator KdpE